jgi:hypothetical protein
MNKKREKLRVRGGVGGVEKVEGGDLQLKEKH